MGCRRTQTRRYTVAGKKVRFDYISAWQSSALSQPRIATGRFQYIILYIQNFSNI